MPRARPGQLDLKLVHRQLGEIAASIPGARFAGDSGVIISGIAYDSRKVRPGDLFVAIPGLKSDGAFFISEAISRGAVAAICEASAGDISRVPTVVVPHSRRAMAEAALALYDHPEHSVTLAAVTGTNGKTTVAQVLSQVLDHLSTPCGVIGTLGISYGGYQIDLGRTTPESADIANHLAAMRDSGVSHAVMEATSIGIDLERTHGLPFRVAAFTNLTRDHLDYHGSETAYREAKLRLFRELGVESTAVINADDPGARVFLDASSCKRITYSVEGRADWVASHVTFSLSGTRFRLHSGAGEIEVRSRLVGLFNVSNLLAVIGCAAALGFELPRVVEAIALAEPARGRMELVSSSAPFMVLIDYAHTPDALEKVLLAIRGMKPHRILTVFGAGGDRDRGKRPEMGASASKHSDLIFVTSDNPRSESPEAILDDIVSGICGGEQAVRREVNRSRAIGSALQCATPGDVVLIAGKGHENYQEIAGEFYPFDDRQVAIESLKSLGYRA